MTDKTGPKRRFHSLDFKLHIVALTRQPGRSVAEVSRDHGLNDNMVFRWRRELSSPDPGSRFLPVEVAEEIGAEDQRPPSSAAREMVPVSCAEVSFANGRQVRLPLLLDDQALRRLIRLVEEA